MALPGAYIPLSTEDEDHPESTMADQLETVTEMPKGSSGARENDISSELGGTIDINWRATTWFTTFFLLTTDVLGPSSIPWSVSKFGYIPATLLYVGLGALGAWSSILLWKIFLRLDSEENPVRTWRDIGDRLCGKSFGHLVTAMQAMQMFLGMAIVLLGNAQSLSQVIRFRLCFVVISILFSLLGIGVGTIRTFRGLRHLARFSVVGVLTVIIIIMVADTNTYPYFGDGSPVRAELVRTDVDFETQLVAAMNMVNAYGGGVLFVELMSEMRDAREFWKAFAIAWTLVVVMYLTYGLYVYSQQGQFTYVPAVQGIGPYAPRTAGNIINILIHITSAAMYCNVTMKSLYYPIVVDRFKGPLLETRKGHFVWCIMAVIVWIFAFILASVIPNFGDLVGVVASLFVLQYTYTLPVFFIIAETRLNSQETWFNTARKCWIKSIFVFLCLVATALGTYSSIRAMVLDVREGTTPSAFSCRSPAQPR